MGLIAKKELKLAAYLTLACAAVVGAVYLVLIGSHRLMPPQVS